MTLIALTHSVTYHFHLLTDTRFYSLTYSVTHHWRTHSLTHLHCRSLTQSLINSSIHPSPTLNPSIPFSIYPSTHAFCHPSIHPFIGIYRLCAATFWQPLEFWATFCAASNLEQLLPPRATTGQQMSHLRNKHILNKLKFCSCFNWYWKCCRHVNSVWIDVRPQTSQQLLI